MRLPILPVALAMLMLAPTTPTAEQESRSPRNASYTMTASLDPATRLLTGRARMTWRNVSRSPATDLRFHMYWNAWRDDRSSWMRERRLARTAPWPSVPNELRGSIELTRVQAIRGTGNVDLFANARYISPDDGNVDDRTLLSVPLDRAVGPEETLEVELGWTAHVPRPYARTGVSGRYFFLAHWFPKIGVLGDDGWRAPQFHSSTEFFADFGTYDVRLTVPGSWIVGATGRQQSVTNNADGTATHRYLEHDVHDFAWTTSPDFVVLQERFDEPGLLPVDVRLLLQPSHRNQSDRYFAAARTALKYFGTWFGPYPYGHITIVDPVPILDASVQGESTGGMEYPTLVTAGTRWRSPARTSQPEEVTIHEVGHQFWYGLVATNEFDHAWMDEGLTTYATGRILAEAYPAHFVSTGRYFGGLVSWPYNDTAWSRDINGNRWTTYRLNSSWDVPATPSWRYWPAAASATNYAKTALWLTALERHLGWETMRRAMATFFSRGVFRHPQPADFFSTLTEVSGQDLTWFVDAVYNSSASFDYAVAQVTTEPAPSNDTSSTIVVQRLGDGVFPVTVRVRFPDGTIINERWDGRDRWRAFRYTRGQSVASVEVDPHHVLTLDADHTNNSWTAHPRTGEAARKWALVWLTWFQHVLMTYAFFA